ncbi:ANTAR domain-containing protein [Mycolicibacterium sp. P1-18]|uniref:ANTAR domain-containing protein n=1 Tax=Mycolicibacterium sp. P1-18 TaxID=2024615 RepID=UPI0011F2CE4E|nr:ANTAR domain-containing protein [Mycolicibacterium sp. P1-18]KAA0098867.1 ANTAR domain-containing protein [Mycolicibacterium sp. P1-18]
MNGSSRVADPWTDEHSGTRSLDVALGILVGLRRCTAGDAFAELVQVSTHRGLSPFALGRALVATASRGSVVDPDAAAVVADEWGGLLDAHRVSS